VNSSEVTLLVFIPVVREAAQILSRRILDDWSVGIVTGKGPNRAARTDNEAVEPLASHFDAGINDALGKIPAFASTNNSVRPGTAPRMRIGGSMLVLTYHKMAARRANQGY
jgi:hypothetical protein